MKITKIILDDEFEGRDESCVVWIEYNNEIVRGEQFDTFKEAQARINTLL